MPDSCEDSAAIAGRTGSIPPIAPDHFEDRAAPVRPPAGSATPSEQPSSSSSASGGPALVTPSGSITGRRSSGRRREQLAGDMAERDHA
ncbi:hypothetical protein, partial [Sphingomonas pituitosa]|uniref:hypothetical protein n=1 Tax=Sphingomonas pituitosa TaxID=99597 RepID=UPI001C3F7B9C